MSKRLFKSIILVLTATVMLFLFAGMTVYAHADTEDIFQNDTNSANSPDIVTDEKEDETENEGIESVSERFVEYLKTQYGADYEYYYNKIIDNWGSVEGYLLAFGDKLPEDAQSDWEIFVGALRDYAPVWATPLAIIMVIIMLVAGKRVLNKAIEKIVNAKLKPITNELNLQSTATVSMLNSQKALMGSSARFAENVKELEEAERGLKGE